MWHIQLLKSLSKKVCKNEQSLAQEFIDGLFPLFRNLFIPKIEKEISLRLLLIERMYQKFGAEQDSSLQLQSFTRTLFGYTIVCAKYYSDRSLWNSDFELPNKLVSMMNLSYPLTMKSLRTFERDYLAELHYNFNIHFNTLLNIFQANTDCIDRCIKHCKSFSDGSDIFNNFVMELKKISIINKITPDYLELVNALEYEKTKNSKYNQAVESCFTKIDGFRSDLVPLKVYKQVLIDALYQKSITDGSTQLASTTEYINKLYLILHDNHALISKYYPPLHKINEDFLENDINFFIQLEFLQIQIELFFSNPSMLQNQEDLNSDLLKYRKLYTNIQCAYWDPLTISKHYSYSFFVGFKNETNTVPKCCIALINAVEEQFSQNFDLKPLKTAMHQLDIGLQLHKFANNEWMLNYQDPIENTFTSNLECVIS